MGITFDCSGLVVRSTFTRDTEVFALECHGPLEIVLIYVDAGSQLFRFADKTTAAFFRADLERELLREGWLPFSSRRMADPAAPFRRDTPPPSC